MFPDDDGHDERFGRGRERRRSSSSASSRSTANIERGRRPSWVDAARPEQAEPLVDAFADALREFGATVATGRFGADMQVELVNDGPVTLLLEVGR